MLLLSSSTFLTALAALAAVLALVLLLARLARRSGLAPAPRRTRQLLAEDTLPLDGRRRLHLVRCGERRVVLLTGGASDVVVGWLDGAEPVPIAGQAS